MSKTQKIQEASQILSDFNIPKLLINEKLALCLLAIVRQKPNSNWSDASAKSMSLTSILGFIGEHYQIDYPDSIRSVFRRIIYTLLDYGIVENIVFREEPIKERPMIVEIDPVALVAIRKCNTNEYQLSLEHFRNKQVGLMENFEKILSSYKRKKLEDLAKMTIH